MLVGRVADFAAVTMVRTPASVYLDLSDQYPGKVAALYRSIYDMLPSLLPIEAFPGSTAGESFFSMSLNVPRTQTSR